MLGKEKVEV